MTLNLLLLGFACAFLVCALVIPLITRLAGWMGAIDTPDNFRRIHTTSVPRMGGVGLALGIFAAVSLVVFRGDLREWDSFGPWWKQLLPILAASILTLVVGVLDDTRGLSPRLKLAGQGCAVLILYLGGIRITGLDLLGTHVTVSAPFALTLTGVSKALWIDLPSLAITLLWFTACMNIWNLIDGMDGLASGVGLIVAGTLMLISVYSGNLGSALLAAALMGSLAGFLLYNWNPACIFLGDSGSLLLGLWLGIIGIQDSAKGTDSIAILFPVVAMGLPICDTAMAIFRRWVRDLPLSSADRRHIHHLLIGLGLTTKQSVKILYLFTAGLCGVVMLGVARRSDLLVLILGLAGCIAFLLVLTSRRDELTQLLNDLRGRRRRRRMERHAARFTWDLVQRIELCDSPVAVRVVLEDAASQLGATMLLRLEPGPLAGPGLDQPEITELNDGHWARFLIKEPSGIEVILLVQHSPDVEFDADILFRSSQKLAEVAARRLSVLAGFPPKTQTSRERSGPDSVLEANTDSKPALAFAGSSGIQPLTQKRPPTT